MRDIILAMRHRQFRDGAFWFVCVLLLLGLLDTVQALVRTFFELVSIQYFQFYRTNSYVTHYVTINHRS